MKQLNPWSHFWDKDHVTTFGDFFKDGYRGGIGEWWSGIIRALPEHSQVLDIGCGNTALLTSLLAAGRQLQYIGLDPANIRINRRATSMIVESMYPPKLLSGHGAESIPLPDASIEAAVSVFGIEYAKLSEAIPEVARVLSPMGRFDWLIHHADSVVSTMSRRAVREFNEGEIRSVIDALTIISREATLRGLPDLKNSAKAESARLAINALAERYLNDRDLNTGNATMFEFMTSALKFFRIIRLSETEREQFIEDLDHEFLAYRARFEQMLSVVKAEPDIENLKHLCDASQLSVLDVRLLEDEQGVIGWIVAGQKAS